MPLVRNHPLSVAICAVAFTIVAGVFLFARPEYRPAHQGETIRIPHKQPALDAAGRQGWVWADGVPGWEAGYMIKDYNVSQVQQVELDPARLAAAHMQLDADQVRVLAAMHTRPGEGPLAILAAPSLFDSNHTVCLGATLPRSPSVAWLCPGASHLAPDIARTHVLAAVAAYAWSSPSTGANVGFYLVGVARGDVHRIVLHIPNQDTMQDQPLYDRATYKNWGQFSDAFVRPSGSGTPELRVYGGTGLVQTVLLNLKPGDDRVIQH